MKVLDFNKPKKVRSTDEHNEMHSSDTNIDGTYVSNMSKSDKLKWKAKHIKGDKERIEIRTEEAKANILIIVYKKPHIEKWGSATYGWHYGDPYQVRMSMNGKSSWSLGMWNKLYIAVAEAKEILGIVK